MDKNKDESDQQNDASSSSHSTSIHQYLHNTRKRDIAKDVAKATAKGSLQLARELTTKRKDGVLPKAVSDHIQQIEQRGEDTIERMVVVRTPVQAYVGKLMQIVSLGTYKDVISDSNYDTMFHLSLLINGRYVLQKNEVIVLTDTGESSRNVIEKGSDIMAVKIPSATSSTSMAASSPLTFTTLLENTKQHMGPKAFTDYCAKANNCQDFILAILQSNGLAYPHLISFMKQDSEQIFNQLPIHTTPVARALTNVAAVGDKVFEDIIVKHHETDYGEILSTIAGGGKELLLSMSSTSMGPMSNSLKSSMTKDDATATKVNEDSAKDP